MTTAMCPGSFDPPTNGHVDVIERAVAAFDQVHVAVIDNPSKDGFFTTEDRVSLLEAIFGDRVQITSFSGLLVDYAREIGADVVVKGLRTADDYDYELQMAQMNRQLSGMETVFMATKPEWSYVSSSLVREVAKLGGQVGGLVPDVVENALKERLQ
jgi:pantetheine-phosphate adenylyltransferase